jgi:hypothetical protein
VSLPCCLLDTLLLLCVLYRLLNVLLPSNLLWLLLVIVPVLVCGLLLLRLSMLLWLCLSMLLLRLGMWLCLSVLLLRLSMLLWLCLSMLRLRLSMLLWLCLSMLLLRLGMFLLLLLLWLGFLLSVLCEGRNNGSERQKQDCCSEICKCFHSYCLTYEGRLINNE